MTSDDYSDGYKAGHRAAQRHPDAIHIDGQLWRITGNPPTPDASFAIVSLVPYDTEETP